VSGPGLSPKQRTSIAEATARINLWEGSVRSGKTLSSIIAFLEALRTGPRGPVALIGKTRDTVARNIIDPMADLFGTLAPAAVQYTRGAPTAVILGRLCHVMGANDARSEGRIRGLTLALAYVDEASLVTRAFWGQLLFRLSIPGAMLFATTNPDSPAHWLKREYLDRAEQLGLHSWHFTLDDNPALTDEYVAAIKAENVGLFRKRFVEGLWVAAEGAIYDMLDLGETGGGHRVLWADVRTTLTGRWWAGVDYGQSNPFHAVLLGTTIDDRLIVCGEWRYDGRAEHRQLSDPEYERRLRGWLDAGAGIPAVRDRTGVVLPTSQVWPERTAVDPSAASFRTMLRVSGWTGLVAADNAVTDGIRNVASLLAARRLLFTARRDGTPAAPWLERELLGYVWDPKATARGEDEPLKADDHGPDALRYGVASCRSVWRPWLSGLQLAA
jgi:PBSX family phage terminase large subunit